MKFRFLENWSIATIRGAIFIAACLFVMTAAWATGYFIHWEYFSQVTLEVKFDERLLGISCNFPQQTQAIQHKEILFPVIDGLKLCDAWAVRGRKISMDEAYQQILRKLVVRFVPKTNLVEIGVYSTDRLEAANIANQIAAVYVDVRRKTKQVGIDLTLNGLTQEVENQRKVVEEARKEATRIRDKKGNFNSNPENVVSDDGKDTTEYISANQKYLNMKNALGATEQRLAIQHQMIQASLPTVIIRTVAEPAKYPSRWFRFIEKHPRKGLPMAGLEPARGESQRI